MNQTILDAFADELRKIAGLPSYMRNNRDQIMQQAKSGNPQARRMASRIFAHETGNTGKAQVAITALRKVRQRSDLGGDTKQRAVRFLDRQLRPELAKARRFKDRYDGTPGRRDQRFQDLPQSRSNRAHSETGDPRSRGRSRGSTSSPPRGGRGSGPTSAGSPTSSPRTGGMSRGHKGALVGAGIAAGALGAYGLYKAKKKSDEDNDWRKEL